MINCWPSWRVSDYADSEYCPRSSSPLPCAAVLPQSNSIVLTLDAAGFREALARVSLLAPEQSHAVCLALELGQLTLSTAGGDAGEAVESWDAAYCGEPLRVAFNCVFLLDCLNVVKGGQVEIALKDDQSAAELRPADRNEYRWRYVAMPMRL
jgi:DNA polymerase III sliding clamp (beta) subunit (PCNA family)